ncbi:MAG: glycosyltransferase family 2 protein [Alphaproteobacteria bacterium]
MPGAISIPPERPVDLAFALVLESENLSQADEKDLWACLQSLDRQRPTLEDAAEILLLDNGHLQPAMADRLARDFPWLTVKKISADARYADIKASVHDLVQSDIIVLCDSDCRYEPGWLRSILQVFENDPEAEIVAGESTIDITGPYSLAIALTYIFPRFSCETRPTPSPAYWANNVAMRRSLLNRTPPPRPDNVFRGDSHLYSAALRRAGVAIWRAPGARAHHARPTLSEWPRRYFNLGRDASLLARMTRQVDGAAYRGDMARDADAQSQAGKLLNRFRTIAARDPVQLIHLPLALPLIGMCALWYGLGRLAGQWTGTPAQTAAGHSTTG